MNVRTVETDRTKGRPFVLSQVTPEDGQYLSTDLNTKICSWAATGIIETGWVNIKPKWLSHGSYTGRAHGTVSRQPRTAEACVRSRASPCHSWWTEWYWDRFFCENFGFSLSYHSTNASYLTLILILRTIVRRTNGRSLGIFEKQWSVGNRGGVEWREKYLSLPPRALMQLRNVPVAARLN